MIIIWGYQMSIELVRLKNQELVYGEPEEIETYCDQKDTSVVSTYVGVKPNVAQAHFKYVGNRMGDPYAVAKDIPARDIKNKLIEFCAN